MEELKNMSGAGTKAEVHPDVGHVLALPILFGIGGTLMVMTVVTVAVTYVDLGKLNLWVALFIAGFKGLLVTLYFMHLRWDRPFNGFVFLAALAFLMLFVGFTMMDSLAYRTDVIEFIERSGG